MWLSLCWIVITGRGLIISTAENQREFDSDYIATHTEGSDPEALAGSFLTSDMCKVAHRATGEVTGRS